MWQLSEAIDGIAEACRALEIPVVGGNVSLYNEHGGADIDPTPVVGVVGVIERLDRRPPGLALASGDALLLLGATSRTLAGSRWARDLHGEVGGTLAPLDLEAHRGLCDLVRGLVNTTGPRIVSGLHDVSDGGLAVCLAEMAIAAGVGLVVGEVADTVELFSESPSRVVVSTPDPAGLLAAAEGAGVAARVLGEAGGDRFVVAGLVDLPLGAIADASRHRLADAVDVTERG